MSIVGDKSEHGPQYSTPSDGLYYGDYLMLDKLLSCQQPQSRKVHGEEAHDETLFIIIHQTYELWFKQILHEVNSVIEIFHQSYVPEKDLGKVLMRLRRIVDIQKILNSQVGILQTMLPMDFLEFRKLLVPASGFQSVQFRVLENRLGVPASQRLKYQKTNYTKYFTPAHQEVLHESTNRTLFDGLQQWLERTPFIKLDEFDFWEKYRTAVNQMIEEDRESLSAQHWISDEAQKLQNLKLDQTAKVFASLFDQESHDEYMKKGVRRLSHRATQAALLISLYREEPILHTPFQVLKTLTEIDENLSLWRYHHSIMVQRMIGSKMGTGGSSGFHYLRSTTSDRYKVFVDLTNLSTFFIPRKKLPKLPSQVRERLGFMFNKNAETLFKNGQIVDEPQPSVAEPSPVTDGKKEETSTSE